MFNWLSIIDKAKIKRIKLIKETELDEAMTDRDSDDEQH